MSDCIFCGIVSGVIPSTKVFEDEYVFAFKDIHPLAPTHILVIPKKHYANLAELTEADPKLTWALFHTVSLIAKHNGLENGYRVAINSGPWGRQVVQHLHIHLLGGRKLADELG